MRIEGSTPLVTGASRGIGAAFVEALLSHGADRVYAGVRTMVASDDARVVPVELDVTDSARIELLAEELYDVDLVVNNAGILSNGSGLTVSPEQARELMEVNYIGLLEVSRAFAPVLAANGGGAFINMLSVASWMAGPRLGAYAASKSAAWSATNAMRIELRAQGTEVLGVHVGFVDTEMVAHIEGEKISADVVAEAALRGLEAGAPEVRVDEMSERVKSSLANDHELIYPDLQAAYDASLG